MILSIRVNNFLVYGSKTEVSLVPDKRIKKFDSNIHREGGYEALKSLCIYGPNNVGKTCILRAVNAIKYVMLGEKAELSPNLFTGSAICSLGISFLQNGNAYSYDFSYERDGRGFIYERLLKKDKEIFVRDVANEHYSFTGDKKILGIMKYLSTQNALLYSLSDGLEKVKTYRDLLREFAQRIYVLSMDNIPINKTIQVLKNNSKFHEKVVELIKLSDLDIEDYRYISSNASAELRPQESALNTPPYLEDMFKLTSVHKGKPVQSLYFDSTGTKKMVAVASYIIEALSENKILIVDELDSSLHFKLTRAIVSLFNNELSAAQLIFSAHDLSLLDCKRLFRKDQIRFADKNETGARIYSLAQFDQKHDVAEGYKTGVYGAIPEPDLISVLLSENEDE